MPKFRTLCKVGKVDTKREREKREERERDVTVLIVATAFGEE